MHRRAARRGNQRISESASQRVNENLVLAAFPFQPGRRQSRSLAAPGEALQVLADLQLVQAVAGEFVGSHVIWQVFDPDMRSKDGLQDQYDGP